MGRSPCCDKANVKKGPWSAEEDLKLREYIEKNGTGGNWITLPQRADLKRCGKSCRLRWLNYLRPNINHGRFSSDEDMVICRLYANLGSRWSIIAAHLPGRTDNDIKNYWNTKLKKKFSGMSIPPHQSSHHHHHNNKNNFQSSTNTNYYTPSPSVFKSLSGESNLEPSSFVVLNSPDMSSSCITSTISQPQLHHQQYYDQLQVQDANFVMVGGEAASSTTSSEGSFGNYNNQISSGGNNYQWTNEKLTEMLDENSLEYFGIEELKKLIGISTTNVDNNNNNLFVDEDRILGVKEEEASIYY